jgi:hypothetical protein
MMYKSVDGELREMTAEEEAEHLAFQARMQQIEAGIANEQLVKEAKQLLLDTDWSQLSEVAPILLNKAEFDAYRSTIRQFMFNPVANPVWPDKPSAQWIT